MAERADPRLCGGGDAAADDTVVVPEQDSSLPQVEATITARDADDQVLLQVTGSSATRERHFLIPEATHKVTIATTLTDPDSGACSLGWVRSCGLTARSQADATETLIDCDGSRQWQQPVAPGEAAPLHFDVGGAMDLIRDLPLGHDVAALEGEFVVQGSNCLGMSSLPLTLSFHCPSGACPRPDPDIDMAEFAEWAAQFPGREEASVALGVDQPWLDDADPEGTAAVPPPPGWGL